MARRKAKAPIAEVKPEPTTIASMQDKTINDIVRNLEDEISELDYIVQGLENHEPYNRMVRMFEKNKQVVDDNWHLVGDPMKLQEFRVTKMAADTLVNFIPRLKNDIEKMRIELTKIANPKELINKDYDGE